MTTSSRPTASRRAACALALLAGLSAAAPDSRLVAAEPPCEFDGVDRVVAVGDVHGAYDRFVEILRAAGVVDARGRWNGGRTHLVQLGDVLDRGPDSRKALDLIQRLEGEAASAGGRVHVLLGNHEALRLLGNFRYTTPGEYAAFATGDSEEVRRRLAEAAAPDVREQLIKETPLGMIEMIQAFGPDGVYGSELRKRNAVERIDGILFVHGGISPDVASLDCAKINSAIRKELSSDLEETRHAPDASLSMGENGPLWYRGLALEPDSFAPQLDAILSAQHARAIVVAHTVLPDGVIAARFGGRVLVIDTGMQSEYVPAGRASALELRGGVFTAIYTDRREVLEHPPEQ
jgi:Calcineurin-like phosphoesterase